MSSKYLGKTIENFVVIHADGKNNKVMLRCNSCGRELARSYAVFTQKSHIKCDCMKPAPKPQRQYVLITYNGITNNATEWAKETGLSRGTITKRFKAGKPIDEVFKQWKRQQSKCEYCGADFIPNKQKQKYCSYDCSVNDKYGEEQRRAYHNFKGSNRIYRNGTPDRSISLTKVYMRDNGICALCGRHIDFDCDVNANEYPTIDHIKPISKGGTHTWDNVQLACRACNLKKSDK